MRKIIIFIFGIIILQLNFSCKTQYSTVELHNTFSSAQIEDLKEITAFFKNQMCLHMDADFKTCYERIPHEYLEATGNVFWKEIDFKKQKELYKSISSETFNEIWSFCKDTDLETKSEFKSVCPNHKGKYQEYLAELASENEKVANYLERIQSSGDFNGFDIQYREVLSDQKEFDLNDPNIQLILAIHYLSLNDNEKRNEKWQKK